MNIYLARHGDALYIQPDDLSPLSPQGEKEIACLAKWLGPLRIRAAIFHSGKLRAQQTAELLAKGIISEGVITARTGLNPNDAVEPIANELEKSTQPILLVGHMPFMGKLAGLLVKNDPESDVIAFRKGTMASLECLGNGRWVVDWVIEPRLLVLD